MSEYNYNKSVRDHIVIKQNNIAKNQHLQQLRIAPYPTDTSPPGLARERPTK